MALSVESHILEMRRIKHFYLNRLILSLNVNSTTFRKRGRRAFWNSLLGLSALSSNLMPSTNTLCDFVSLVQLKNVKNTHGGGLQLYWNYHSSMGVFHAF